MATFFCFLRTITELYSEEVENNSDNRLPDIPSTMFYDTSISYFEMERVGGLASYLYKAHHREVSQSLSIPDYISPAAPTGDTTTANRGNNPMHHNATPMPSAPHMHLLESHDQQGESSSIFEPPPGITIAVPRIQAIPVELDAPNEANGGILSTNAGNATATTTTQTSQASGRERISMPPPPPPPRQTHVAPAPVTERDENNGGSLSATSSGEDIPPPLPVPHLGAALLAGTPR